MCMYVLVLEGLYAYVFARVCVCIRVWMAWYVCAHLYVRVSMCKHVCLCMGACACICACA